jgi:hypothetical protein
MERQLRYIGVITLNMGPARRATGRNEMTWDARSDNPFDGATWKS